MVVHKVKPQATDEVLSEVCQDQQGPDCFDLIDVVETIALLIFISLFPEVVVDDVDGWPCAPPFVSEGAGQNGHPSKEHPEQVPTCAADT